MKAKSYAKINLALDVINKRDDGYHNIKTIMQKISIYDELEFKKIDKGFKLNQKLNFPVEDNLIYKAWKLLCEYAGMELPIEISLNKKLPVAAGIAGGTGNGAVTLKALNKLYDLNLSIVELQEISLKLGADFPYMLSGGTMFAEGIGEKLKKLEDFNGVKLLIVNPGYEISTKEVYENLVIDEQRIDFEGIIDKMRDKSANTLKYILKNKMQDSIIQYHPQIREIIQNLDNFGSTALMSGSGATVFGLFDSEERLKLAYEEFSKIYKYTFIAETVGGYDEI